VFLPPGGGMVFANLFKIPGEKKPFFFPPALPEWAGIAGFFFWVRPAVSGFPPGEVWSMFGTVTKKKFLVSVAPSPKEFSGGRFKRVGI